MFDRSTRLWTAAGTVALLPLAMIEAQAPHTQVAVSLSAQPVAINFQVVTAVRPLDLAKLTAADFGDTDSAR